MRWALKKEKQVKKRYWEGKIEKNKYIYMYVIIINVISEDALEAESAQKRLISGAK